MRKTALLSFFVLVLMLTACVGPKNYAELKANPSRLESFVVRENYEQAFRRALNSDFGGQTSALMMSKPDCVILPESKTAIIRNANAQAYEFTALDESSTRIDCYYSPYMDSRHDEFVALYKGLIVSK